MSSSLQGQRITDHAIYVGDAGQAFPIPDYVMIRSGAAIFRMSEQGSSESSSINKATQEALGNLENSLKLHGLALANLIHLTMAVRDKKDWTGSADVYRKFFIDRGAPLPARSTVAIQSGSSLRISFTAITARQNTEIATKQEAAQKHSIILQPIRTLTKAETEVIVSGQAPDDDNDMLHQETISIAVETALGNVERILKKAGATMQNIYHLTMAVRDKDDQSGSLDACRKYFQSRNITQLPEIDCSVRAVVDGDYRVLFTSKAIRKDS